VGVFENRQAIEANLDTYIYSFLEAYQRLCNQKCPTMYYKLPFLKQGIHIVVAYGMDAFLILARDSRQPPMHCSRATWDETEYSQLATAGSVDTIAQILELEEVLYCRKLDSLETGNLREALGSKVVEEAGALLEENMRTIQPTLEDAADRMQQAYRLLFLLENNLRQLIEQELKKQFSEGDWWEKGATYNAKKESEIHQQDSKWKWHEPMTASPLNYVNFNTLHDIIVNKNWGIFEDILGPKEFFSSNFGNLEVPRNLIAHNNVLSSQEFYNFRQSAGKLLSIIKERLQ